MESERQSGGLVVKTRTALSWFLAPGSFVVHVSTVLFNIIRCPTHNLPSYIISLGHGVTSA